MTLRELNNIIYYSSQANSFNKYAGVNDRDVAAAWMEKRAYDTYFTPYNPYDQYIYQVGMEKRASLEMGRELAIEKRAAFVIDTCLSAGLVKHAAAIRYLQLQEFHPYGYEWDTLTDYLVKESKMKGKKGSGSKAQGRFLAGRATRNLNKALKRGGTPTKLPLNIDNPKILEEEAAKYLREEAAAEEAQRLAKSEPIQRIVNAWAGVSEPMSNVERSLKGQELGEAFGTEGVLRYWRDKAKSAQNSNGIDLLLKATPLDAELERVKLEQAIGTLPSEPMHGQAFKKEHRALEKLMNPKQLPVLVNTPAQPKVNYNDLVNFLDSQKKVEPMPAFMEEAMQRSLPKSLPAIIPAAVEKSAPTAEKVVETAAKSPNKLLKALGIGAGALGLGGAGYGAYRYFGDQDAG